MTSPGTSFDEIDARMDSYVREGTLPCVATTILSGTEIVHQGRHGYQDLEDRTPLRDDAIFRMYSNTKIITSVALMILHEEGHFQIDDPLSKFLPKFSGMDVLTADAQAISDTVPADSPILIRHILTHSAGLSYSFLDPSSVIDKAYVAAGLGLEVTRSLTLEELSDTLAGLPLCYQPGSTWRYSYATDVCARLVEVISGQAFDTFLRERLLDPLGMSDTDFWVPESELPRLTTCYSPTDRLDPMKPGLVVQDHRSTSSYKQKRNLLSGGGGLVSTMADYTTFIQMIVAGGTWNGVTILQPETLSLMRTNHLADGVDVKLSRWPMPDTVFGLGFALKTAPQRGEPASAIGEYQWGGMAGTHSWMAPRAGLAGLVFTQVLPSFMHPFLHDFKRLAYAAVPAN